MNCERRRGDRKALSIALTSALVPLKHHTLCGRSASMRKTSSMSAP
jgi:hypothetical protein